MQYLLKHSFSTFYPVGMTVQIPIYQSFSSLCTNQGFLKVLTFSLFKNFKILEILEIYEISRFSKLRR